MPVDRSIRKQQPRSRKLSKARKGASTLEAAQVTVGNFLRATRERLNLTQAQVADKTRQSPWQLSRAAVSAIERGQNFPGLEAMLALSNVLHIDPKEVIERARLTAVVPVDITGLSDEELEHRASELFWAGDFRHALSVYDALVQKLALQEPDETGKLASRLATLEIRRATTLRRAGALISAIASAERAIFLARGLPAIQAEAYVVLSGLQAQRGHLPLASDAAERAIELAKGASPKTLALAWMVKARELYLGERFEQARQAYLEAGQHAEAGGDSANRTHIEGNIGMCWLAGGNRDRARECIRRAVELAHERKQPALEASWLVELGKIALDDGHPEEAERLARTALRLAKPRDHRLTVFRAEWLRHRITRKARPQAADRQRLSELRNLFMQLDQYEGIEEIKEFKETILGGPGGDQ